MRTLAAATGISKTEINASLKRSMTVGTAKRDCKIQLPKADSKALLDFIVSGLRYVYPANPGAIARGIVTDFEAHQHSNDVELSDGQHVRLVRPAIFSPPN